LGLIQGSHALVVCQFGSVSAALRSQLMAMTGSWDWVAGADTPVQDTGSRGSIQRQGSAERWRFLAAPALLTPGHAERSLSKEQTMKLHGWE
jgi:hypothetical protein